MTTAYSTLLGLALPVTGELSGTWGDTVDNGITRYLDIAVAGTVTLTNDGAVTLSLTNGDSTATNIVSSLTGAGTVSAQFAIIRVTGTLTVAKVLTAPSSSRTYVVVNAATGSTVTVKASGQTGVSIAVGETAFVYFNGTDYAKISGTASVTSFSAGTTGFTPSTATTGAVTLGGTLATTNGGTGLTSFTANQVFYASSTSAFAQSANLLYSGTDLTVYGLTVGRGAGAVANNTAVGASALAANTTGAENTAVGLGTLSSNTTGTYNTAVGRTALNAVTTGSANTGVGRSALEANTTGGNNTSVGMQSLFSNTTASNNTAVGYQAGYSSTAANQTFVGYQAGYSTTTGQQNTAVGQESLKANTTGIANVAMGAGALLAATTASNNTGLGYGALQSNTTASNNTAVGYQAAYSNTTATEITAIGKGALYSNTTGGSNTAVGLESLTTNTTGSGNTAIGVASNKLNTTGANNSSLGVYALLFNTTGGSNTAIGTNALYSNTTSSNNTAVGYQAGYSGTGANNVFLGYQTGYAVTTGTSNTLLGLQAGYGTTNLTSGTNNTLIGSGASTSAGGDTHSITVSCVSVNGKGTGTGFIAPGSASAGAVYQGNNSTLWSVTSDQRLKKNIVDNNTGLDIINQIQVRNFEYRLPEEITDVPQDQAIAKTGVQLGVIAQELQQILPECVKTESTGVMTVDADNLTWYLINAVKELTARIKQLEGN